MKLHSKNISIREVCTIQTGYTARGRLQPATRGGLPAIQMGDFSQGGHIVPERLTRVDFDGKPEKFLVGPGDVLFRSRGEKNIAVSLDDRFVERAVAVLPIYILRPRTDVIQPEYLAWIINQAPSQRYFDRIASTTTIRMVPRSSLEMLEIQVPSLELQRKITALDTLTGREHALTILAADRRRDFYRLLLESLIKDQLPSDASDASEERNAK